MAPAAPRKPRNEFVAKAVRDWITAVGARSACIEPCSPWENGHCENFNASIRDELLNREIFYSPAEARIVIETWRRQYNTRRPHSTRRGQSTAGPSCRRASCCGLSRHAQVHAPAGEPHARESAPDPMGPSCAR